MGTIAELPESPDTVKPTFEEYAAPEIVKQQALLKDWAAESAKFKADPDKFWEDIAKTFVWTRPWTKVFEWDGIHHKWFTGARTNITVNALDRHVAGANANRVAYIWLAEDGSERVVTYGQLFRDVCRFANGLKSLGVKKGDRVVIYMPLTLEGVISMLACARIGAIHSVVYAGLGHTSLRDRIEDAQARVVIVGDSGVRRGKPVPLKPIVDEALDGLEIVDKVVVFTRDPAGFAAASPREVDFRELMKSSADCPAEDMDAEDPLFILYTSGTTGKPKGVVHVHGGFMVGTTYHLSSFFDISQKDVFWCTSDIGWIVGHSYIVYAPLCGGVTTIFREGAIDYPDPSIAWQIVEKYGVTKMFTAPTALRMFMRYGEAASREARSHFAAFAGVRRRTAQSRSLALGANPHRGRWQVGLCGGQLVANGTRWSGARHPGHAAHASGQSRSRTARLGRRRGGYRWQARCPGCKWKAGAHASRADDDADNLGRCSSFRKRLAGNSQHLHHGRSCNQGR